MCNSFLMLSFIVYFDNKCTCTHPGKTVNVNNPNYI